MRWRLDRRAPCPYLPGMTQEPKVLHMKCPGCGATASFELRTSYFIGEVKRATGFQHALTEACDLIWMCPSCFDKCAAHIEAVYAICGDRWVHLRSFVKTEVKP